MSHHKISIRKQSLIHVLSLFFLSLSVIFGLPCSSIVPHRATINEVTSCCRARYSEELKIWKLLKSYFKGSISSKVIKPLHYRGLSRGEPFFEINLEKRPVRHRGLDFKKSELSSGLSLKYFIQLLNFKQSFLNLSFWELLNKLKKLDILTKFRRVSFSNLHFIFFDLCVCQIIHCRNKFLGLTSVHWIFLSFYGFLIGTTKL